MAERYEELNALTNLTDDQLDELRALEDNAELANGGRGPCTVDGLVYDSREAAERALGGKPSPEVRERAEELGIDLDARTAMEAFR